MTAATPPWAHRTGQLPPSDCFRVHYLLLPAASPLNLQPSEFYVQVCCFKISLSTTPSFLKYLLSASCIILIFPSSFLLFISLSFHYSFGQFTALYFSTSLLNFPLISTIIFLISKRLFSVSEHRLFTACYA